MAWSTLFNLSRHGRTSLPAVDLHRRSYGVFFAKSTQLAALHCHHHQLRSDCDSQKWSALSIYPSKYAGHKYLMGHKIPCVVLWIHGHKLLCQCCQAMCSLDIFHWIRHPILWSWPAPLNWTVLISTCISVAERGKLPPKDQNWHRSTPQSNTMGTKRSKVQEMKHGSKDYNHLWDIMNCVWRKWQIIWS